ncbi:MAG: NAD/NADP octopine/nopaline dehydrogenase family protein [Burkholderiales bacterium]
MKVAIVGAGAIGRATAAYLAHHGHAAALWSPSGRGTAGLLREAQATGAGGQRGRLTYDGALTGVADVGVILDSREVADAEAVVIALPGDAYPGVLPKILPYLHAPQTVIVSGALSLVPLWLHERLRAAGTPPVIAAWGTTLGTARLGADRDHGRVQINTIRSRFEVAAIPAAAGAAALDVCRTLFGDRFRLVGNLLETALSNINPEAHAAEVLPNLSRIDKREPWMLFDCLTASGARLLEAMDLERLAVARAFGLTVRTVQEHYHLSYHVPLGGIADIAAAIHARYQAPPGPTSLDHRYVREDMPFGLAFFEALARVAGVATPLTSAAVTLLSAAVGQDLRAANPLLTDLAIEGAAPATLLARCRGEALG